LLKKPFLTDKGKISSKTGKIRGGYINVDRLYL